MIPLVSCPLKFIIALMKLHHAVLAACILWPNPGSIPAAFAKERAGENRWEVDYGANSCRLIRHFVRAGKTYRLEISQNLASGGQGWVLYGTALPVYTSAAFIEIEPGPEARAHRFNILSFVNRESEEKAIRWEDADGGLLGALREDRPLRITDPGKLDLAIGLPKVGEAVKALEKCENDLIASWGFDAAQFRSLGERAQPSGYPGRWATNDDYPRADAVNRNEGMTMFLLTIGADGKTSDCRIIGSSGFPGLDVRTCELLLARATFRPARDGAGQAVKSFYVNRIRWQLPR